MLYPQKIKVVKIKLLESSLKTPEKIGFGVMESFNLNVKFELGFKTAEQSAKADITFQITTDCRVKAEATYHFVFFFHVENLSELVEEEEEEKLKVNSDLSNALASIAYSTSRGLLIEQLKHTVFENFMLPVIDAGTLLKPSGQTPSPEK